MAFLVSIFASCIPDKSMQKSQHQVLLGDRSFKRQETDYLNRVNILLSSGLRLSAVLMFHGAPFLVPTSLDNQIGSTVPLEYFG